MSAGSQAGCPAQGNGLGSARWVTISPDGKNAYVASDGGNALSAFSRDQKTGALRQLPETPPA